MIVGSGISRPGSLINLFDFLFLFFITVFIRRVILGGGPGEESLFM